MSQISIGTFNSKETTKRGNDDYLEECERKGKRQKFDTSAVIDLVAPESPNVEIISLLEDETDSKPRAQQQSRNSLDLACNQPDVISLLDNLGHEDNDAKVVSKASERTTNLSRSSSFWFEESIKESWTHQEKEKIYEEARRPEKLLRKQLTDLYKQRKSIESGSDEWTVCEVEIEKTRRDLAQSEENAAKDIYNRNNIAGGMGKVGGVSDGKLVVDFHGLRVKEAISQFDEMIMPVLPVQKEIHVVTGRGKHSKTGKSTIKMGLIEHAKQKCHRQGSIKCRQHPSNPGMIIFYWVAWNDRKGLFD
mmetsp:Transcript_16027/g.24254  ORF Transcript_16027/g.24254 Transcript_16027/m.24254 type:complete len:306 (+) Transcript_16027:57-974(+)